MLSDSPVAPTLGVKDLERAKEFYEGTLGLKPSDKLDDHHVIYECGGTKLVVYKSGARVGETTSANFTINDLDGTMTELRAKGVKFEDYDFPGLKTENGVATWGESRSAWFKDPDGNILALTET